MARHKVMAEELLARAESNGYEKEPIGRRTANETKGSMWIRPRRIKNSALDRYVQ
jgi:hypothetical protein